MTIIIPKEFYRGIIQSPSVRNLRISFANVDVATLVTLLASQRQEVLHVRDSIRLESLVLSHCPLTSRDLSILSLALRSNRFLLKLELSSCEIDDDGIVALCEHLSANSVLTELSLPGNCIGPIGAQQLMKTIANHSSLWELNLSNSNAIGHNGIALIGEQLAHVQIGILHFSHPFRVIANHETDKELRDEACQALADGLQRNTSLQELYLHYTGFSAFGLQTIVRGLAEHPTLEKLSLHYNCTVNDEGVNFIGQELVDVEGLTELDLSCCLYNNQTESNDEARTLAVVILGLGLGRNRSLNVLRLCCNDLISTEAQLLMILLRGHPTLSVLDLSGNSQIGFEGLKLIADELPTSNLEQLYLRSFMDSVTQQSEELKKAAVQAGQALVNGVKRNFLLRTLDLDLLDNQDWKKMMQDQLDLVEFYLELNRCGRYLMRGDFYEMEVAVWAHVLARNNDNINHLHYFLKEQPWLVQSSSSRKRKVDALLSAV